MRKLLLIEDDPDLGEMLKKYLELSSFIITWAKDGMEGYEFFENEVFDICLIDVMMPRLDGFSLASKIIEVDPAISIIFLTALSDKANKIKGLKLGVDDYIVKPFDIDELILRINNTIDRNGKLKTKLIEKNKHDILRIGKYTFDYNNLSLFSEKTKYRLTEKEAELILYLNNNKGRIIRREGILNTIWEKDDFFSGRSLDVFISRLRKYFREDKKISIKSIRGIGFEFETGL